MWQCVYPLCSATAEGDGGRGLWVTPDEAVPALSLPEWVEPAFVPRPPASFGAEEVVAGILLDHWPVEPYLA